MIKQSLLFSLKIATGTALLLTMVPSSAKAAIIWSESSGLLETNNFWYNGLEKSGSIMGFDEEQQVTLNQPVGYQTPNDWEDITNLSYLDPAQVYDSHMIYFSKAKEISGRVIATATIKFSGIIAGLIGDSRLLYQSNPLFAPGQSNDPQKWHRSGPEYGWSLEGDTGVLPSDMVTILDDGQTIEVAFTSHSALDPLRVITISPTQAVPEPLTLLGAGSAIAMGGFFKSKLKNKAKDA